ncbi:MAG: hypothetical protein ABJB03_03180 [Rhodoglobus sp.]
MTTPSEIRRKAGTRRAIGWWAIALALVPVFAAVYVLVLNVEVVGGSATIFTNCGTLVEPVSNLGRGGNYCAQALAENALFVGICGVVAVCLAVVGIVLLIRTPRYSRYS